MFEGLLPAPSGGPSPLCLPGAQAWTGAGDTHEHTLQPPRSSILPDLPPQHCTAHTATGVASPTTAARSIKALAALSLLPGCGSAPDGVAGTGRNNQGAQTLATTDAPPRGRKAPHSKKDPGMGLDGLIIWPLHSCDYLHWRGRED